MTTNTMAKPASVTAVLNNWYYHEVPNVFSGEISGDTKNRFDDGTFVYTSPVKSIDTAKPQEDTLVTTRNSVYRLGKPA